MSENKLHQVKVHIKSVPYQPRGKAGEYRAGSVQILDAAEAYELDKAGIAIIVEDPYYTPIAPRDPYVSEPVKEEEIKEEESIEEVVDDEESDSKEV